MIPNEHTEGRLFMALCMGAWIVVLLIALVAAMLIPEWDAGLSILTIAAHVLGVIGGTIIGMVLAPRKVVLRDGSCTVKRNDEPYSVTPYYSYSREIIKR